MRTRCMKAGLLLFVSIWLASGGRTQEVVRVALVHGSYDNYRHRDDYDAVMKQLGWRLDKYENKDFGRLVERLGDYDLVLGTALFNYQENVQDFSVYKEALWDFMARGGAIVWTDTNYETHVNWLAKWGEDWRVGLERCGKEGTPITWISAGHPIFSSRMPIRALPGTWMHMLPGSGWQVIAHCADEKAVALFRPHGRGFMLLTSFWRYNAAQLENVWGTLQYTRAGLLPESPDLSRLTWGDNSLEWRLRNLRDESLIVTLQAEIRAPTGQKQTFTREAHVGAGETGVLRLLLPLKARGEHEIRIGLAVPDASPLPTQTARVVLPALIEAKILQPKYRGWIMSAAPPQQLCAHVELHPFEEKLAGLLIQARLWERGQLRNASPPQKLTGREKAFELAMPLRHLPRQNCTLEIALLRRSGGPVAYQTRLPIAVVPVRQPQVFVDEQLNLRVNGALFFPIAIYHVGRQDFARVKALGFNAIQAWGTSEQQARENLDAAQAAGLKVVLEGTTHLARDGNMERLAAMIEQFKTHPALLAWYLTDEPSGEEQRHWCRQIYEFLQARDPDHPAYLTSCSPNEFADYVSVTDIFAVDPYPIPSQPITMVSAWMERAQQAAQGRKPVWLIPQLHNWAAYSGHPERGRAPTPEEERNMVYQGLVWGAKGIFYYPWDDNVTGLIKEERLQEAIQQINAELAELGPKLLQAEHKVLAANDEKHPGLYAALYRGQKEMFVIAVSVLSEARRFVVPMPGVKAPAADVLFENRQAWIHEEQLVDEFAPLGVHVYRVKQ